MDTTAPASRRGPRLAIVLSHPIQYYSPWFRWLHATTELCLRVFYLSDFGLKPALDEKFGVSFAWNVNLIDGYDCEFVPNTASKPDTLRYAGLKNPQLIPRLAEWRPDAVLVFGYKYHTHVRLIAWCQFKGIPLVFRGDSHLLGRDRLPLGKRLLLKAVYRQFAAVTFVGAANRDYFRRCGVPEQKLFFAPHAVDASHFNPEPREHHRLAADLRAELEIPSSHAVVLFSGKLIPEKQPRALLEAFIDLHPRETTLVIAGDGPEKPALEQLAALHPTASVRFLPFGNQQEMPARYLMASLLVLPSRGLYETWGLSVNEAMQMGVPCLVSDRVGCHLDLVSHGQTGWVFPADKPRALATALADALADVRNRRCQLREAVLTRIHAYSYEQATHGLLRAVAHACGTQYPDAESKR